MILARGGSSIRPGALTSASTNRGGIAWAPEAKQMSDREIREREVVAPS
jgi:hypothetical protein